MKISETVNSNTFVACCLLIGAIAFLLLVNSSNEKKQREFNALKKKVDSQAVEICSEENVSYIGDFYHLYSVNSGKIDYDQIWIRCSNGKFYLINSASLNNNKQEN